jgi:hypothetical protein
MAVLAPLEGFGWMRSLNWANRWVWNEECLHGMSDQGRVLEIVLVDKRLDVLGHGNVVMPRGVRGVTMVAKILIIISMMAKKKGVCQLAIPTRANTCLPRSRASCL